MKSHQTALPAMSAIRVFESAARFEHFTKAGEDLMISQAAVSYQIKSLENKLGIQLFVKNGRGVSLTGAGRLLANDVCSAFDQLRSGFAHAVSESEKNLSIGCLPTFAYTWLQPRLQDFRTAHPNIEVQLSFVQEQSEAYSDRFDIGINSACSDAPFRVSVPLMSAKQAPLCSPEFAKAARLRQPQDLANQPLLGQFTFWQLWFVAAGVDAADFSAANTDFAVGNLYLEVSAAIASMGITLAPVALFSDLIASGKLIQLFDIYSCDDRMYYLTCSKSQLYSPKIRAFRTWILDQSRN